jgi:hypothetical protein
VATLVEAAHRQSDLRGRLLPPHAARDPIAAARDRCGRSHQSDLRGHLLPPRETRPPPCRGRSRPPQHGCWCATWWGREHGTTTTLVLIVVVVPATLVNDHLLLLEHGSLRVDDGDRDRDGTMATTTAWTTRTASHCASRRPCHADALSRASRLSCSERREKREKRG